MHRVLLFLAAALAGAAPAAAQEDGAGRRTRVALGPQLVPSFPGADSVVLRPFIDVDRARGSEPFAFEAADESAGFPLLRSDGFSIGPAVNLEGSRKRSDTDGLLHKVPFTVEAGGFVQYQLSPSTRLRGEIRRGIGGHDGWIANLGADYVARSGDEWLLSIGPRATLANGRYNREYFGITPEDAAASGLRAYSPDGGLEAVGATAGFLRQFNRRWGMAAYLKYDRLVGDAAHSPVVATYGSRDQISGGIALSYTFGR